MANYKNFYENIEEAQRRLLNTVVMYDEEPYYVLAITNHAKDDKFRIYLDKLGQKEGLTHQRLPVPYAQYDGPAQVGIAMDEWLEDHENCGIIRKFMGAKGFDRYRPFPLGMLNTGKYVTYVERQPTRNMHQGLTQRALNATEPTLDDKPGRGRDKGGRAVDMLRPEFYDCVMGNYPSAEDSVKNLLDPDVLTSGVGIARNFALLRGPMDMLFLAYKTETVGVLPESDLSRVRLGQRYSHLAESVEELGVFGQIAIAT